MPTTAVTNTDVDISWAVGVARSGTISGYLVYIKAANGYYKLEDTYCNGMADPVFTDRACSIPNSVLRAAPYSLTYGTTVEVIVGAVNEYGTSGNSSDSTAAATIETEPQQVTGLAEAAGTSTN